MTDTRPTGPGPFTVAWRVFVWLTIALLTGIVAFTAAAGVIDSMPFAWTAALAAGALTAWRCAASRRLAAGTAAAPRVFRLAFVAGTLAVAIQLVPLTLFIVDANRSVWAAGPWRPWQSRHSCASAYWVACEAAPRVPNLYDESVYRPVVPQTVERRPNLGPFLVDVFEYPPTFLAPVRALAAISGDFWRFRRLWFALNLAGVVIGLVAIARRVDGALGTHAVWLAPWALAAPSVMGTLQAGNVQLLFLVLSAVAMLLFERGRPAAGGLLLGYAIASKLYPGVLVLYLLLRGDRRAVGWTAAAGVLVALVTVADLGWTPVAAFVDQLPKIVSGEAFPGLYRPAPISINESIPGIVFKLGLFGVPGMGFPAARIVGWIYSVILVAAIAWLALRRGDRRLDPLVWIAILILATLRSPFLPGYGAFPSLWLATLVMAVTGAQPRIGIVTAGLWIVLALQFGQGAVPVPINAVLTFGHTVAALVLVFAIVPRVAEAKPAAVPQPAVRIPA